MSLGVSLGADPDEFDRPPRRAAPVMPSGEVSIEAPPAIGPPGGARTQQWLSMLPMLTGTLATAMLFGGREGASAYTYVVGGIFGLSTLGMLVTSWTGANAPRKAELMQARRTYLRYLSGLRGRVRSTIDAQRQSAGHRHPPPQALWAHARSPRLWERRGDDADFGVVRVGVGPQTLATPLVAPVIDPVTDLEPVTAAALRRFLDAYSVVSDLPISLAVRAFSRVVLTETDGQSGALGLARAIIAQLATFHAPNDLVIAAAVAPHRREDWEWLKWLPHALSPIAHDPAGASRLVFEEISHLEGFLAELLGQDWQLPAAPALALHPVLLGHVASATTDASPGPHVVVVIDGLSWQPEAAPRLTRVEVRDALSGPIDERTIVLNVATDATLTSNTAHSEQVVGRADSLAETDAEGVARALAPIRLAGAGTDPTPVAVDRDLADLLGLADLSTAEVAAMWATRPARDLLRVPIGLSPEGQPIELDLKEAAQGGMGPHGLVIGATGSGKSELLRTLVLGLAVTHPPELLNVVLIDFKGGATFAHLDRLPHTSAVITNLADELPLVDRMHDALSGELTRRQELLRRAGNFASVRDYEQARAHRSDLPPLPALLIVCDEFTELLAAKPDLADLFLQIGRVGRSLAMHLLLATQRLEEGRLRGLEANLSYKIALRTFTAGESRVALGVADAAELPATPGHGYLRVGTGPLRRFKAAFVSGAIRGAATDGELPGSSAWSRQIWTYTTAPISSRPPPRSPASPPTRRQTLMELIVDRLTGRGSPAHQVWLPPLGNSAYLDDLLGEITADPVHGLTTVDATLRGQLRVPVALVDRPFDQRRDVGWLDLAGAAGHVAIVGGPQAGKSTAVRTLVTALALTHTPRAVQVYCLDFGGGALAGLGGLPHVGGVASRLDATAVRRTVGEVAALMADRERRRDRIARSGRPEQPSHDDPYGQVFLVVDGWSSLRSEYEDLEPTVIDIAARGLSYGVHLVATAHRWVDFRASRDLFGSRLELRLGDPGESAINRRSAANVPAATPGRGLTSDGLHLLTAVPATARRSPDELVAAIAAAWPGVAAPPVRMLPTLVPYADLLTTSDLAPNDTGQRVPLGSGLAIPIGVAEADLKPVLLDFAQEPHLVVYGDGECGKSALLRSLASSLVRRFDPAQARLVFVDYRRSLLGAVTSEHLIGYGTTAENTATLIDSVAEHMDRRRPGPEVTTEQLRERTWWVGPECFVLVDDYDLVATPSAVGPGPTTNNPLLALLPYLAQARDIGLHLVVVRRAGGAGRAQFEPVLQRLRELSAPGLVMSGPRDEGALVGAVRPGPLPPGRGWLVTRREGTRLVQLAWLAPDQN